jgi:hypothetical protein
VGIFPSTGSMPTQTVLPMARVLRKSLSLYAIIQS